ncbi:hypothetical protein M5D96_009351 [Drosophila gunungcola]|uniref:Uncharacterized protein n=1 Tax=Drosophila gunungcola TaxID=103775 RepID=A0A9Q0BNA2_9MUSC|nr:hypothetical protein M5D96_009351 [Drosophila gunungcola]
MCCSHAKDSSGDNCLGRRDGPEIPTLRTRSRVSGPAGPTCSHRLTCEISDPCTCLPFERCDWPRCCRISS